jgi:hypothetical protein
MFTFASTVVSRATQIEAVVLLTSVRENLIGSGYLILIGPLNNHNDDLLPFSPVQNCVSIKSMNTLGTNQVDAP